jgi:hypothetical protein
MFKQFATLTVALILTAVGGIVNAASSPPAQLIPAGTVITQDNWQKYQQYMLPPLSERFASTSQNAVVGWPKGAKIIVGTFRSYPLPSSFWDATEKYSKQVSLEKVPNGSYTIKGYVAGMPFPNLDPKDPMAGFKLMYDVYFQYHVAIQATDHFQVIDTDRYANLSLLHALSVSYQWQAITDVGYPMAIPGNGGVYFSGLAEQLDPEQIKYVTAVNFTWFDPTRFPESYVFLPSIRRALRLSSAARCAPFQGQDFANDDTTPTPLPPTWFSAKYLGMKPVLMWIFKPEQKQESIPMKNWDTTQGNFVPKANLFGDDWMLRNTYIVEESRLPQYMRGYCYSKHQQYLDQEEDEAMSWVSWDQNGKYWRDIYPFGIPFKNGNGYYNYAGGWAHIGCDFQNWHCSALLPALNGAYINHDTPQAYQNRNLYGTPAGLQQIMQ